MNEDKDVLDEGLFNEKKGQTGYPVQQNYLVESVLVAIFCCTPLGIYAVIKADEVNRKNKEKDYVAAQKAADQARLFVWLSFGFGIIVVPILIGVQIWVATL